MDVVTVERKSAVLTPSSLACLADIPAINLTAGCVHGCIYCYARGYSTYPGDGKVIVYRNTLEKVKSELLLKRIKSLQVYFSPSTDVFQPVPEVIELGYSIFKFLFSRNMGISFLTKGVIPDKTMELFLSNTEKVKAQIGIITPDENIGKIFEPNAASIETRLKQMGKMVNGGIDVEARMMPILPGITDNLIVIERLFKAIADTGVRRVAISTLFLRPTIAAAFRQLIPHKTVVKKLFEFYENENRIDVHAKNSSVIPLPRQRREKLYADIKNAAERHNLEISICGCMNPDIGGSCNIAGNIPVKALQPSLFD